MAEPGALYGYDIVKRLRGLEGLVIREGTVYPILSRLRAEGFLETVIEESTEGPPRKYYELIPRGREQLASMSCAWGQLVTSVELAFDAERQAP